MNASRSDSLNRVELPRKRVLKDRTACVIYSNGPGAGQDDREAAEALLTAILKVERDPAIVRQIMSEAAIDPSVWESQLDQAMQTLIRRLDAEDATDDVLAGEFLADNPGIVFGQREWMHYDGSSWTPMPREAIQRGLLDTMVAAKDRKVAPNSQRLASVETFVRVMTHVPDADWDANPNIIVTRRTTLEVAADGTYTTRENRAADYARDALPFDFDPNARADVWHAFLRPLDRDVVAFLQEFAGYALTGDTSCEMALWLLGDRGTGRSTFIEGLLAMLGARAGRLGLREIAESRFGLPPLVGKRLVYATESPSDYVKSADTLINIISGEPVFIEAKGKDVYEYRPSAKIVWAMNALPQLRDQHSGLWRRVKIVKFPALTVEPNPAVKEAIKREGPGILVWALEGLRRLRQRGSFNIPDSVVAATEEYRQANDIAAEFAAEFGIEPAAESFCTTSELIKTYNHWRRLRGYAAVSDVSAASDWARLGFERKRGSKGVRGYLIKPDTDGLKNAASRRWM